MALKQMQPEVIATDVCIQLKQHSDVPIATIVLMVWNQLMFNIPIAPNVRMELRLLWTEPTVCYVTMDPKLLMQIDLIVANVQME